MVEGEEWKEEDFDWLETIAKLRLMGSHALVAMWVGPDIMDSNDNIVQVQYR